MTSSTHVRTQEKTLESQERTNALKSGSEIKQKSTESLNSESRSSLRRSDTFIRTFMRYAEELEVYIQKNRAPPPDIQHWPYGPYWPKGYGPSVETPKFIRSAPSYEEPLWSKIRDGKKRKE